MGKNKVNTWEVRLTIIDKGELPPSTLINGNRKRYYLLARDIKEDLEYFFRKINGAFRLYKIKNIKKK